MNGHSFHYQSVQLHPIKLWRDISGVNSLCRFRRLQQPAFFLIKSHTFPDILKTVTLQWIKSNTTLEKRHNLNNQVLLYRDFSNLKVASCSLWRYPSLCWNAKETFIRLRYLCLYCTSTGLVIYRFLQQPELVGILCECGEDRQNNHACGSSLSGVNFLSGLLQTLCYQNVTPNQIRTHPSFGVETKKRSF